MENFFFIRQTPTGRFRLRGHALRQSGERIRSDSMRTMENLTVGVEIDYFQTAKGNYLYSTPVFRGGVDKQQMLRRTSLRSIALNSMLDPCRRCILPSQCYYSTSSDEKSMN